MGIGELHKNGIMHRDVKLENIMVDENGFIKIIDYGIAKFLGEDEVATSICGTPLYMSPEMVERTVHNMQADWWAVGVLLYELLIGIYPFFHKTKEELVYRIKNSKIIFPSKTKYNIEYSDDFVDLVSRLLCKSKNERLGASRDAEEIL